MPTTIPLFPSVGIHEAINTMVQMARRRAPRVAESALDSCCTDTRPNGPIQRDAWDLVNMAFRLNAISELCGWRDMKLTFASWEATARKMPVY